uniref:Uncharacterized protein n=1 Tax=Eutreptiella gymnastica TaxID=73025 RepID=A0A7S1NIQ2_9EUGL|mmetsp:Transcript_36745/g.65725  ORF Transcript_36745/g.65725 Transcript_36745/m.65725 type:complete len:123 (+) Transcript_36745:2-370(+)
MTKDDAKFLMFILFTVTKLQKKTGRVGLADLPKVFDKEMFTIYLTQSSLNYVGDEMAFLTDWQRLDQPLSEYYIHAVDLTKVPDCQEKYHSELPADKGRTMEHQVSYCLRNGVRMPPLHGLP